MQQGDGNVIKHAAVDTSGDSVLHGTVKQTAKHLIYNESSNM
jgi:hypothetical protein